METVVLQAAKEYHKRVDGGAILIDRFDRARLPSLFDRAEWFDLLHHHCFAGRERMTPRASDNSTEAWLNLVRAQDGGLTALANYYSFSWRPLFKGEPDKYALLARIARDLGARERRIELYPVLADDGSLDLIRQAFGHEGWITVARPMGVNHYLDLGGRSFEEYWASRSGALRSTVRRKGRQHGMDFTIHRRFDAQAWRDYEAIYRQSWKPAEGSMAFLRAIAEQEGAAGTLRLGLAHYRGQPVAAQYWTVEHGTALIHKLAHVSALDAASPGTLLSAHMFRAAIDDDRVDVIDYGTGDNPYKTEWMDHSRPLYRIDCFNRRSPAMWLPAIKCQISRLVGHRGKR